MSWALILVMSGLYIVLTVVNLLRCDRFQHRSDVADLILNILANLE